MSEGGHISQLVCSCPIQFESTNMSDLTCSPDGASPFPKLLGQGEEAFAADSVHALPRLGVPVPDLIRLSDCQMQGSAFPGLLESQCLTLSACQVLGSALSRLLQFNPICKAPLAHVDFRLWLI